MKPTTGEKGDQKSLFIQKYEKKILIYLFVNLSNTL